MGVEKKLTASGSTALDQKMWEYRKGAEKNPVRVHEDINQPVGTHTIKDMHWSDVLWDVPTLILHPIDYIWLRYANDPRMVQQQADAWILWRMESQFRTALYNNDKRVDDLEGDNYSLFHYSFWDRDFLKTIRSIRAEAKKRPGYTPDEEDDDY